MLGEDVELAQTKTQEEGKKDSLVELSVKDRMLALQDISVLNKDPFAILSPMSGTVLNFSKILEDTVEMKPGLKMSLKHLLLDDKYEPYTAEDLEELKL